MNAASSASRVLSGPRVKALWLIALLGCSPIASATPSAAEGARIPLTFEANRGQTDARVDFLARGERYTFFVAPTEAVFALSGPRPNRSVLRMQLVNSARDARVQGLEELPGKVNYLRGNDSSQWRTNVPTYKAVKYTAVYPGIDLVYYGQPKQLEYDFIVAAGADPGAIKLAFIGIDDATVDAGGDLVLKTAGGSLRFQRPVIYQTDGAGRHSVEGGYVLMSPHEVGFRVGDYDRTRPLIIDPVLSYSTYLGGSGEDSAEGIALDAQGAIYVSGTTGSVDFPTVGAPQPDLGGANSDAFVVKLTPDGATLVYATYLGGSAGEGENNDEGRTTRVAVDASGAAYVAGVTRSSDFPVVRAFQSRLKGDVDAFVAKLSADGSQLIYSTYLGGSARDQYPAIAVDLTGAAYISGSTFSTDFPTASAFQPEWIGGDSPENAFVTKLTPDGASLAYSTYLGGAGTDAVRGITVDAHGAAYVVGITTSANFPTLNAFSHVKRGEWDSFVAKLAPDGKRLIYSTYLGGSDYEDGFGIAVDANGAAYVAGETTSQDFPTMNPLQPRHGGSNPFRSDLDAYVVKLAADGSAMVYGTFLGGFEWDRGYSIAVDTAGAAYVAGFTDSKDFPTRAALQAALRGPRDAFVAKLDPSGAALVYSTYLGGRAADSHIGYMALALDPARAAYVTGATESSDFPSQSPLQRTFGGGPSDAFVIKVGLSAPAHVTVSPESEDFPAQVRDIQFGEAVAIRNGIAFVGSPKAADGGHVAVLNLTAIGWNRVGTVKLPESVARNLGETQFGRVLTWRDGVLVVGGGKAAYYFSRSNGVWTFRDVVRPQFLSPGSVFPVALRYERGDADIAGSPQLHGVGTLLASELAAPCCPSRVHIFHLSPTRQSFLYAGFVQPSDGQAGDNFGADISMTSREFVVGSPRGSRSPMAGLPAYDQSGAAYIFRRGADGRWRQGQKLLPSGPAPGFGTAVAIDNDMIIVGAPKVDIEGLPAGPATADGHTAGGAAYVFVPGVGRYVQARELRPRPDQLFAYQDFGYRVAMFGPRVAIAAARPYEPNGLFPFGLVVAYTRDGASLLQHGVAQGHVVAASMSLANNWLLLGVPYERSCPTGCVGSAHIFDVNRLAQ